MHNFQPSCKCIGLHIYNTSKAFQIGQIRLAVGEKGIFPFDWQYNSENALMSSVPYENQTLLPYRICFDISYLLTLLKLYLDNITENIMI